MFRFNFYEKHEYYYNSIQSTNLTVLLLSNKRVSDRVYKVFVICVPN